MSETSETTGVLAELARLEAMVENEPWEAASALPRLIAALEAADEALKFYALYGNYGAWLPNDDGPDYLYEPGFVELDEGKRALAALTAIAQALGTEGNRE